MRIIQCVSGSQCGVDFVPEKDATQWYSLDKTRLVSEYCGWSDRQFKGPPWSGVNACHTFSHE